MSYYINTTVSLSMDEAVENVTKELAAEGFGILTEIDVAATLKNKLDVDFPPYRILGACSPASAYEALQAEIMIGTMLPCNVIVRALPDGDTEVAAVDPMASMQAVENADLAAIAAKIQAKLKNVIARVGSQGSVADESA